MKKIILVFLIVCFSCKEIVEVDSCNPIYKNTAEIIKIPYSVVDFDKFPDFRCMANEIYTIGLTSNYSMVGLLDSLKAMFINLGQAKILQLKDLLYASESLEKKKSDLEKLNSASGFINFNCFQIYSCSIVYSLIRYYFKRDQIVINKNEEEERQIKAIIKAFTNYNEKSLEELKKTIPEIKKGYLWQALRNSIEFIKRLQGNLPAYEIRKTLSFSIAPFKGIFSEDQKEVNKAICLIMENQNTRNQNRSSDSKLYRSLKTIKLKQYLETFEAAIFSLDEKNAEIILQKTLLFVMSVQGIKRRAYLNLRFESLREKYNHGKIKEISKEEWAAWQKERKQNDESEILIKKKLNTLLTIEFPDNLNK